MKKIVKILIWFKNFILNIMSLPAYTILSILLFYIMLIEMCKGKVISKAIKEYFKIMKK
jgi:hypothetical protein